MIQIYSSVWQPVYESLRRSLSGTWRTNVPSVPFELKLDAYGRFRLSAFDTGRRHEGRYAIVLHRDSHYIVFDDAFDNLCLKIDDLDRHRLRLLDPAESYPLDFTRRRAA